MKKFSVLMFLYNHAATIFCCLGMICIALGILNPLYNVEFLKMAVVWLLVAFLQIPFTGIEVKDCPSCYGTKVCQECFGEGKVPI